MLKQVFYKIAALLQGGCRLRTGIKAIETDIPCIFQRIVQSCQIACFSGEDKNTLTRLQCFADMLCCNVTKIGYTTENNQVVVFPVGRCIVNILLHHPESAVRPECSLDIRIRLPFIQYQYRQSRGASCRNAEGIVKTYGVIDRQG